MRDMKAPFIPELKNEVDTRHFDKFEEDKNEPFYPPASANPGKKVFDPYFPGYTFKKETEIKKSELFSIPVI